MRPRSRRPLIAALIALAVLAGQWVCAVHESDHALQNAAATCLTCVATHGAGAGALPAMPLLALAHGAEAPEAPLVASPLATTLRHHPIRGPPALLA